MKVYISGPITGKPDGNIPAFQAAAEKLRAAGHEPVNPHDIDPSHDGECRPGYAPGSEGHTSSCHMRADLRALLDCDAITMIDGWTTSRGAWAEHGAAGAIGLEEIIFSADGRIEVQG